MCTVSVILPTYNRACFLPEAFSAIRSQLFKDWELVVVDDGSTDNTPDLVSQFADRVEQPVAYTYQENAGAYAARNAGLNQARGRYIAFYDSDDLWLPHHLLHCWRALDNNSDIDWVFGDLRRVFADTGEVVTPTNFNLRGEPCPFMGLRMNDRSGLRVLTDERTLEVAILHGIPAGLHSSLIRRSVFDAYRFDPQYRNGQDRFAVIEALTQQRKMAFFTDTHLEYRIHDQNDSLARAENDMARRLRIIRSLIDQYKGLRSDSRLTPSELRAVYKRIARELFWGIGHHVYWVNQEAATAIAMFLRGIYYDPLRLQYWKALAGAIAKSPAVILRNALQRVAK